MSQEIIEQLQREWKAFKDANDARLAEIEKHGTASAETTQKVERANAAIASLQAKFDASLAAQTQRLDEIEDRLNRPLAGGRPGLRLKDEQIEAYARWQGAVQRKEVDPAHVDLEFCRNYTTAFRDWARHGHGAEAKHLQLLNEMSVGSDADGGFWVSPDMSGRMVEFVYETSPVRRLAAVQEISTDALEGDYDLNEAGTGGWVGETETRAGDTATPGVGGWRIPVHEQYAEPRATQKLLDDARIDVEAWLAGKVAAKFGREENTAFVSGNGVARPRGFLTYTAGTPSAAAFDRVRQVNSGAAAALTSDGLVDLVFALKSIYRLGARFGMNRTTEAAVRKLKDGQNNYLWQPDFTQRASASLLGFPIEEMPDMPDVAAGNLPVVFANFAEAYQIVDRAGIRVLRDPYTTKGRVKFYTTKRVGGGVVGFEAILLQKVSA